MRDGDAYLELDPGYMVRMALKVGPDQQKQLYGWDIFDEWTQKYFAASAEQLMRLVRENLKKEEEAIEVG